MSVFDEIKQKMHEVIDKALDALHGTADLDAARTVAQATTEALHAQALQVEAQLIKHVADNAAEAEAETAKPEPAAPETTGMAQNPEPVAAEQPAALSNPEPTQ
jgi:hypothetical protein